jgi:undecaprenyl diphosphate synthase
MALFQKKNGGNAEGRAVPRHIAIIMDGNGRWAKNRGLPRTAGHAAGAETFRRIATYCKDIGVEYLTVYAFSTENWKRSETEVSAIMGLLEEYLLEAISDMEKNRVRIGFFGDLSRLSPRLQELARQAAARSEEFEGVQVNLCVNYGGRDEIVRAAREYARACAAGEASPDDLDEEAFSGLLYSAGMPDPDLVIRPSGEIRISNFLLWQSAYAEYYFTDVLWPDFTPEELERAIESYNGRSRRFGGVK